ncbi:26028_t:CDS:2, partial [Gigaspora margarita]
EFWDMIKKTKDTNSYALYGVYIENCVKDLGFYDLLNQAIYEPIEFINAKNIILKLQHMDVNPVAKIISQVFHKLSITPNDLLLSGILNIENIIVRYTLIREELIEFILEVQRNLFVNIHEGKNQSLFSSTKDLLWRTPEYTMQSPSINESTWKHDVLDPIVKFITYDLEEDIFIRYYEWEILLGEVSNRPFINTMQIQSHISDDHNKLGKCAKDALNDTLNFFNLNYSTKTKHLKIFKEINIFLIYAHRMSLELFILDQKFEPFFQLRKLSNILIPYKLGTIGGIIDLVQSLQIFKNMLIHSLSKMKEIVKTQPQFNDKENSKKGDCNFIRIPTQNTPTK